MCVPGIHPRELVRLGDGIYHRAVTKELAGGTVADHTTDRYLALVWLASGLRENTENAPDVVRDDSADLQRIAPGEVRTGPAQFRPPRDRTVLLLSHALQALSPAWTLPAPSAASPLRPGSVLPPT